MKKNYIAPNTEMIDFASEGLMQNPNISVATTSGGVHQSSNMEDIQ